MFSSQVRIIKSPCCCCSAARSVARVLPMTKYAETWLPSPKAFSEARMSARRRVFSATVNTATKSGLESAVGKWGDFQRKRLAENGLAVSLMSNGGSSARCADSAAPKGSARSRPSAASFRLGAVSTSNKCKYKTMASSTRRRLSRVIGGRAEWRILLSTLQCQSRVFNWRDGSTQRSHAPNATLHYY